MKRILSIAAIVGAIVLIGTAYGMIAGSPNQASADEATVTVEQPEAAEENQPNEQTQSSSTSSQTSGGLTPTNISASEAINIAEKAYSGTATEMDRDVDDGQIHYDIEIVINQDQSRDVIVDANTGKITVDQDDDDYDDDHDDFDDEDDED
ncbi:PepSY domain-containing protein [Sporolactobacillus sp. STSJ-5]|uniref:PepSY domain-containing protein n=1 Tax=Sporolactobacillus sp. STSJ-5 TaxID=2965076 RepID=UPI002105A50D|nr:PepSY domain-containing protein [Sporolactobacillus sp. STSJ-5]MCQ2009299.1 PepSY domain-containing protein [Sporolactobacillus sp. STSJ-5]